MCEYYQYNMLLKLKTYFHCYCLCVKFSWTTSIIHAGMARKSIKGFKLQFFRSITNSDVHCLFLIDGEPTTSWCIDIQTSIICDVCTSLHINKWGHLLLAEITSDISEDRLALLCALPQRAIAINTARIIAFFLITFFHYIRLTTAK